LTKPETGKFSVYFDQSCPMCRTEIAFYQRRSGAENIDWIDVSQPGNAPAEISCAEAMARFHIRTTRGELVNGGAAFAHLWKQLPAFRWLGLAFDTIATRWILNLAYDLFLPLRPHLQGLFRSRAKPLDARDGRS
jgi:predicted DCC family thiol-disulfide oxidoreductase YuxK